MTYYGEILKKLYVDEKLSIKTISELVGTTESIVKSALKDFKIPIRSRNFTGDIETVTREQMEEFMLKDFSRANISEALDVSASDVGKLLSKYGLGGGRKRVKFLIALARAKF